MSARPRSGTRLAGFTLIEVLMALAIMATLAITGYRALSGMIEGEQRITRERERWRELDLFFARLEHDLGHALPRAWRIGNAGMPAMYLREGALAFVRGNLGEPPQRVGYRWNDGRIELLYWPRASMRGKSRSPTVPRNGSSAGARSGRKSTSRRCRGGRGSC